MNISLIQVFGALLTIGVRLTGIMLFAPFFGSVGTVIDRTPLSHDLRKNTADDYQSVAHDGFQ